jgi:gas vesicle protein
MSKNAVSEKLRWVGSITGGILVGAAAALLVAGIIGVHESSVSTVRVSNTSQIQQAP